MPSSGVQTCALRSEEHTSELQSPCNLGCRLLLEKKNNQVISPARLSWRGHHWRHEVCPALTHLLCPASRRSSVYTAHPSLIVFFFFFFNDPAPPEISPLPLHAALPISHPCLCRHNFREKGDTAGEPAMPPIEV